MTTGKTGVDEGMLKELFDEFDANTKTTAKASPKKEKPKRKVVKFNGGAGKHKFSKVFGPTFSGKDFEVEVFADSHWPDWALPMIPTVDESYVFSPYHTERMLAFMLRPSKRAALLHGPTGSGKSTLPEQICARLRIPMFRINLSRDSTVESIMGGIKTKPNEKGNIMLDWAAGPVELAAISGGIVLMDEFSFTPSGTNTALQRVMERGGALYLEAKPDEHARLVTPKPSFKIIATDNTRLQGDSNGNYVGTHVQNEATINRFQLTMHVPYMDEDHELTLVKGKVPQMDDDQLRKMREVAKLVRSAYDKGEITLTLSPRGLIEWAEEAVYWDDMATSFCDTFYNKLGTDAQQIAGEIYRKVFGQTINTSYMHA